MFKQQTRVARSQTANRRRRMMVLGLMALAGSAAWATDFTTGTSTITVDHDSLFINDDDGGPTVVNLNSGTIATFVNVLGGANGGVTFNMNGGTLANTNGTNSTDSFQVQETAVANIAGGTSELPVDLSNSAVFNYTGGTFNGSLTVNDTATATIAGGSYAGSVALFNSGRVVLNTGTIANVTNINSGTILNVNGIANTISGNLNVKAGGTLNVNSGATLTASGGSESGGTQGSYFIDSSATLNFSAGTQNLGSGVTFTGQGTLQFGGATANLISTLNMDATNGATRITSGTVNFNSGVTITSFGSALNITGGTAVNFNTALDISSQIVNQSGNTVNVNAPLTANVYNLSGGTLAGASTFTVSNLTWSGGTMNLAGSTIINSGNTATLSGATTKTMQSGRIFQIDGVAQHTAGTLAGNNTSVITGAGQFLINGGTANIANTINMNSATGETRLTSGTLNINSGAIITSFGSALNVTGGTVNINSGSTVNAASFNTGFNHSGGTLGGTGTFAMDTYNWSGGTMTGVGTTIINSAGTATISGATTKTIQSGRTFQINGLAQFTTGTLTANNTSVISGAGQFLMTGGTLNLNSGMLYSMNNITGSTEISGGTVNINSGASFSSVGSSLNHTAGTINVNTDVSVAAPAVQSGGTLQGPNTITFSDFTWTGGTMSGTGTTVASTTAIIGGSGVKTLQTNRTFTNNGALIFSGTGNLAGNGNVTVNNNGTWDHQTDADYTNGTGSPVTFNNAGTFTKSVGTGVSNFNSNWTFQNNSGGQVNVNSGTLNITGGGDSAGAWSVAAGGTLSFNSGTFNFNSGTTLSSAGTTNFSTGNNNLNSGNFNALSGGEIRFNSGTNTIAATLASSGGIVNFIGGLNTLNADQNISSGSVIHSGGTLQGLNSLTAMNLTWSGGFMDQGGATIVDTGGVATLSGGTKTLGSSRIFTNKGALAHTAGNVVGNDSAVVNNNAGATWDLQSDADFANGAGPVTFNNAGAFTKSAGTGTSQFGTNWAFHNTATGQINVNSGILQLSGGGDSAGAINIAAGSRLQIDNNPFAFNSGASLSGSGTLLFASSTLSVNTNVSLGSGSYNQTGGTLQGLGNISALNLSWTGGSMTDAGATEALAGGSAIIGGGGAKTLGSGRVLTVNSALVYNGSGNTSGATGSVINNNVSWDHQTDADLSNGTGAGATFNNAGSFTKSAGAGTTSFASNWTMNNTGTVNVLSGALSFASATSQESAGTLTDGDWNVNSATLGFATALTRIGAAASVTLTGSSASVTGFSGLDQNDGYFENAGSRNFNTSGAFLNNGTLAVTGGANFIVAAGNNFTNNGTVKGDSFITTSGGGTFINNGVITPGSSPGSLNFISDFQQSASGSINIEIGGTTAGSQHDQLSVGAASLNGTLNISLINGFDPGILDSFQILNFSSRTGTFSNVTGLHYSATERLNVVYNSNHVLLVNSFVGDFNLDGSVGVLDIDQLAANFGGVNLDLYDLDGNAAIGQTDLDFLLDNILHRRRGDADLDGDVDTADLSALRTNLGSPNHSWANGNFDGDLDVDTSDLSIFRTNIGLPPPGLDAGGGSSFGGAGSLTGSSVPEPSALALLALGSVAMLRRRSR